MAPAKPGIVPRRRGFSYQGLLIALVLLVAVPAIAYSLWPGMPWSAPSAGPMTTTAQRGGFVHEITDRGNVESASNVEIRCEVRSQGTSGTTILEIIPEGSFVQPGDLLVRLDSSSLEDDRIRQQISVNDSEAKVIEARNAHETALIAKQEYEQGTYVAELKKLEADLTLAEENRRRADDYHQFSKRLAEKGYVTQLQLEADKAAADKAAIDLDLAQTNLRALKEFTRRKMLIQLDSNIGTTLAKLRSAEGSHEIELSKLRLIETQIEKCTIYSPDVGQVVYANTVSSRGGTTEVVIEEGATVRENQVIIRLPDPKRMQVKAKIAEGKVAMVAAGMSARIRLDAYPDLELSGTVEKVNDYPEPTSWFGSNVKEYMTTITIHDPPKDIRPGLTAQVTILVERLEDVVCVPVQAVFEHGGKFYSVGGAPGQWQPIEVEVGATNDKQVVVERGLEPGQVVVLNAAALREQLDLPKVGDGPGGSQRAGMRRRSNDSASADGAAARPGPGEGRPGGPPPPGGADGPGRPPGAGPPRPSDIVGNMLERNDRDGDGKLSGDEIPAMLRDRLAEIDTNRDGALDRTELIRAASRLFNRGESPGPPGAAPTGNPP